MLEKKIVDQYDLWKKCAGKDTEIKRELQEMEGDFRKIEDSFYRELEFGTGGLRGILGAGTNRMNIYTVAKVSQGLANYVCKCMNNCELRIAVSYDSRINSDLFAKVTAEVFAANGIKVFLYRELMPTPCLSYAVRKLNCVAGVMITASHNPSKYNGYKVYNADGCQITIDAAEMIQNEIAKVDMFHDVKDISFEQGMNNGLICYVPEKVYTDYIEEVKNQSMLDDCDTVDKNLPIIYSPLNGTGLKPVLRTLTESGYTNVIVVREQELPDGTFPTCAYPNPEVGETLALGIEYARKNHAGLVLATDPDCDRVGIAVESAVGDYVLLSGNETGMLLLDYICARRRERGTMPRNPIMYKTIVTIDMAERIAAYYGVKTKNVLTGFKYIGEQIGILEKKGEVDSYIFGFEESYGYLSGAYVRDKDAVNGSLLICEMYAFYKKQGISLLDKLNELYNKYGFCLTTLHSYEFDGLEGFEKMMSIMKKFRDGVEAMAGRKVIECMDYIHGRDGLPKSDVLKFCLEGHSSVVIRPSGTEPKLKVYITVSADRKEEAEKEENGIKEFLEEGFLFVGECV